MQRLMRKITNNLFIASLVCYCVFVSTQISANTNTTLASVDNASLNNASLNNTLTNPVLGISDKIVSNYVLKPFSAEYVAYRSGNDVGSAVLTLTEMDQSQFELTYRSKVSRFFLSDKRFEKTVFLNTQTNLVPVRYEYKRTGTGPNKKLHVDFDSESSQIVINDEKRLDWQGEFDNQLFRIDLPQKLAQGVTNTTYQFINYRGQKRQYVLEVIGTDNLNLPYGQLSAYKVKINRQSNSRVTYAWFAPSLGHNLVRLQQFKDDKEQGDMKLGKFSFL